MKKLLTIFSVVGLTFFSAANTISCSNNQSTKSFSNVYTLGDSLSDVGAMSGIAQKVLNNSKFRDMQIKQSLPGFASAFAGSLLDPSSIADSLPPISISNIINPQQVFKVGADNNYYEINKYLDEFGNQQSGFAFSDGLPAAGLLAQHYGYNPVPGWDTSVEQLKINSQNFVNTNLGNNYAVGGAVANDQITISKDKYNANHFKDSIFYQSEAMAKQHKDLSSALIFMDIGGNDLFAQKNYYLPEDPNDFQKAVNYLVGSKISYKTLFDVDGDKLTLKTTNNYSDLLNKINDNTGNSIFQLLKTFKLLKENNAKNVVFATAPDISEVPMMIKSAETDPDKNATYINNIHQFVNLYNNFAIAAFNSQKNSGNWHLFGLYDELNKAINIKKAQKVDEKYWKENSISEDVNISEFVQKLLNSKDLSELDLDLGASPNCNPKDKDNYVFWDTIHPNEWVHKLAAADIINELK